MRLTRLLAVVPLAIVAIGGTSANVQASAPGIHASTPGHLSGAAPGIGSFAAPNDGVGYNRYLDVESYHTYCTSSTCKPYDYYYDGEYDYSNYPAGDPTAGDVYYADAEMYANTNSTAAFPAATPYEIFAECDHSFNSGRTRRGESIWADIRLNQGSDYAGQIAGYEQVWGGDTSWDSANAYSTAKVSFAVGSSNTESSGTDVVGRMYGTQETDNTYPRPAQTGTWGIKAGGYVVELRGTIRDYTVSDYVYPNGAHGTEWTQTGSHEGTMVCSTQHPLNNERSTVEADGNSVLEYGTD